MLNLLRSDLPADASTKAIARALAALTPSDLVGLKRLARLRARLLPGLEWDELLNEALLRALDGSRRWPEGVPLLAFLAGIMRSLVDSRAEERRRLAEQTLAGIEARVTASPEAQLHARQCLAAITQFFAGDPDVLALITELARQYLGDANKPIPRLSQKRRDAARKRLARAILRGQLDGVSAMTEFRDNPDAAERWRATIEALETVVLAECDEPEPDCNADAAAEEIRRLIMVLLAGWRRSPLPAAWVRRPGIVLPPAADSEAAELKEQKSDRPPPSRPGWRE